MNVWRSIVLKRLTQDHIARPTIQLPRPNVCSEVRHSICLRQYGLTDQEKELLGQHSFRFLAISMQMSFESS